MKKTRQTPAERQAMHEARQAAAQQTAGRIETAGAQLQWRLAAIAQGVRR